MVERKYQVNSVVKAISIMEALAGHGESSLADLKNDLGLDKATLHRILSTLKSLGYVSQNPGDQRYALTLKMFQVGNMVLERGGLKSVIHPYLERLCDEFQETVYAAVMTGPEQAIIIDKTEIDLYQQLRLNVSVGGTVSFSASSMGRCFLAFMNPEYFRGVFDGLTFEKFTPQTITEPAALLGELEKIRAAGYAVEEGERIEGVMCISVPILDERGHALASISTTGPKTRMLAKKDGLVAALTSVSKELSAICGYRAAAYPAR